MQISSKKLVSLGAIAALVQANTLPNLYGKRDEITVSGTAAGGSYSCHLMWTASDTWKGAGCSKGSGFGIYINQGEDPNISS